ncbi:MAG: DNA primase [Acidimicrobiia bacterium]|nr:DNA primase [Acidimicrobiia bacterium]
MGIVDEDIARVRESTDVVQLIAQYTQLKRVGRRWSGLCPFHGEKTPSFSVNAELGLYHCFGCQKSGDAITFIREIEHLDFVGAVEHLAGKAGISLRYDSANENSDRRRRKQLTEAIEQAVDWYHDRLLAGADAGPARAYLRERGLDGDTVRHWKIGWAPDDWDQLAKALRLPNDVLDEAGLGFVNRRGRAQDSFRARVMFPIRDLTGAAVGFGGRIMPGAEGPKYKNSQDSAVYHKSRVLYGLYAAKDAIVRADQVVVCEGYTDVIGFHSSGLPRAVATCGTALTEDHVRILRRFASKVVLAFDADAAGQAAAERFYEWEKRYDVDVSVADLPPGVDPGELAQRDPARLTAAVEQAKPFLGFRVDRVLDAADMSSPEGRARAAEIAASAIAEHPNELVRDQYLVQIAEQCGVDLGVLRAIRPGAVRPRDRRGSAVRLDNGSPAATPQRSADDPELHVLRLVVHRPDSIPDLVDEHLFARPLHQATFDALLSAESLPAAIESAEPEVAELIQRLAVEEPADDPDARVARLIHDAAVRELDRLNDVARRAGDVEAARASAELKLTIDAVRSSYWQLNEAARLLDWLPPVAGERA